MRGVTAAEGLCEPVVRMTNRFFHEARCLKPQHSVAVVKGCCCYRPRGTGERKCIADANLSVLKLILFKMRPIEKGVSEPTDTVVPWWLNLKRAGRIQKVFNASEDDTPRMLSENP